VTPEEWARIFTAFGPRVWVEDDQARMRGNPELGPHGSELTRRVNVVDQLGRIDCPTLVCVGALDPVAPVAAAQEIVDALPDRVAQLEVLDGAGHFPWKDVPDRYWPLVTEFVAQRR
jgi:proline iminopeptidase